MLSVNATAHAFCNRLIEAGRWEELRTVLTLMSEHAEDADLVADAVIDLFGERQTARAA